MDSLGDRCKRYEASAKQLLAPRIPVMGRLDGRAFHSFTRKMARPYDEGFHACMRAAAQAVCADMAGCKMAYVQSDEISFLLVDYDTIDTEPHFGYDLPKLCSTSASLATAAFMAEFFVRFPDRAAKIMLSRRGFPTFDARFYNVPASDVENVFLWRQRDAERNSLSMLCQTLFSHAELQGKDRAARHEMLHAKGVNWAALPTAQRRGVCVVRQALPADSLHWTDRPIWTVDTEIPIFSTEEGRTYIRRFLPDTTALAPKMQDSGGVARP